MRIVVDENITHVYEAFSALGELTVYPGRSIDAQTVRDADVLLVRTVTGVDEALLAESSVKFVGTATSGLDHIDLPYLERRGIGFGHAQGANANSVANYVISALLEACASLDAPLEQMRCGIVGYGHVGARVYTLLTALGMQCQVFDPPLALDSDDDFFYDWDAILDCQVITFHTPLSTDGPCPTHHMVNHDFMNAISPATILLNTSRGEVMDTRALIDAKTSNPDLFYIFDVWENEPEIDVQLLELTDIATPHIAGYSWDGKVDGTRLIYDQLCAHLGCPCDWSAPLDPISPTPLNIRFDSLRNIVRHAYPILVDDQQFRAEMAEDSGSRGNGFDRLRREYRSRREFEAYSVESGVLSDELSNMCEALGFRLS